jgi:hypothetical protein
VSGHFGVQPCQYCCHQLELENASAILQVGILSLVPALNIDFVCSEFCLERSVPDLKQKVNLTSAHFACFNAMRTANDMFGGFLKRF